MPRGRTLLLLGVFLSTSLTAGCAERSAAVAAPRLGGESALTARIVQPAKPLQCVPYAREVSGIPIFGNAWTWWRAADGKYAKGSRPELGAVMVFSKTKRNRYGHLAVVKQILNSREVIVDHSNWLNRGRIHLNAAVRDVSPNNDWSAVRVWYTPGKRYGARVYALTGFIYGDGAAGRVQRPTQNGDPMLDPKRLKRIRERLRVAKAAAIEEAAAGSAAGEAPMPRRRPERQFAVVRTSAKPAALQNAVSQVQHIEPLPTSLQTVANALREAKKEIDSGR